MLVSRLTRSVAVAVASLALLAPVAGAMPAPDPIHVPATQTPQFAVSETASQTLPGGRPANAPVPAEHSSDYSWGSTAVYAGIAPATGASMASEATATATLRVRRETSTAPP